MARRAASQFSKRQRRHHTVQSPLPDQSGHPITTAPTSTPGSGSDRISNSAQTEVSSPAIGDFWVVESPAGTVELRYKCADGVVRTVHTYVYA